MPSASACSSTPGTLPEAAPVFECAVALRAALIAASPAGERWDARLALGVGAVDPAGPGFSEAAVLSGQGLDSMQKEALRVFSTEPGSVRGDQFQSTASPARTMSRRNWIPQT